MLVMGYVGPIEMPAMGASTGWRSDNSDRPEEGIGGRVCLLVRLRVLDALAVSADLRAGPASLHRAPPPA